MRNSRCEPKIDKAKEVILYILNALKEINEESLTTMLYLVDFNFYEKYEEHFLGLNYLKKEGSNENTN